MSTVTRERFINWLITNAGMTRQQALVHISTGLV